MDRYTLFTPKYTQFKLRNCFSQVEGGPFGFDTIVDKTARENFVALFWSPLLHVCSYFKIYSSSKTNEFDIF